MSRDQIDVLSLQLSDRFNELDGKCQAAILDLLTNREASEKQLQDHTFAVSRLFERTQEVVIEQHNETRKKLASSTIHSQGIIDSLQKFKDDMGNNFEKVVLRSLDFPARTDRFNGVSDAYGDSFKWIYRPSKSNGTLNSFAMWLKKSDGGIYWVNGKAASGKSTLMRWLSRDAETRRLLAEWAGSLPVVIATCFFWSSGTTEQKSQAGFLRSLLYETFQQMPSLTPVVLPELLATLLPSSGIFNIDQLDGYWTQPRLLETFKLVVTQDKLPFRVCFFIDGLDEFSGDYEEMVTLFSDIKSSPNIKACISSRPLILFDDAFGNYPGLRLQDLTHQDIKQYVEGKLAMSSKFRKLLKEEPATAPKLIEEIVTKADGVFLWVKLVVKSLIEGLGNRDTISELQRRLRSLPSDLEALYSHMMTRIDPFYLPAAAKTFQLAQTALAIGQRSQDSSGKTRGPLTTMEFICAVEEAPDLALKADIANWQPKIVQEKKERAEVRVKIYSAGLLEVRNDNVHYMHRTVRDYMVQPEPIAALIDRKTADDFNPNSSLLAATILQLKVAPTYIDIWHAVITAFECANRLETADVPGYVALINEMDRCLTLKIGRHWCRPYLEWLLDDRESFEGNDEKSFLAAIVHYGLYECVGRRPVNNSTSSQRPIMVTPRRKPLPLLKRMSAFSPSRGGFCSATLKMSAYLLQSGEDPNEGYGGTTTWQDLLIYQRGLRNLKMTERESARVRLQCWTEHLKVFIQFGARLNERVEGLSLNTAIAELEEKGFNVEANELLELAKRKSDEDPTNSFIPTLEEEANIFISGYEAFYKPSSSRLDD